MRTKLLYTCPDARSVSSPLGPRTPGWIHAARGAWNSRNAAAAEKNVQQTTPPHAGRWQNSARTSGAVTVADGTRPPVDLLPRALLGHREVVRVELHAGLCSRASVRASVCMSAVTVCANERGYARFVAKLTRRPLFAPARETTSSDAGPSRESAAPTRSSSGVKSDADSLDGGGGAARGANT